MPRPANPGWRPKTIKLSAEVIEAVWVKAAREGKTPGRLINDILARALLQSTTVAEESPAQQVSTTAPTMEQQATDERIHVTTEEVSPKSAETTIKEPAPTSSEEPIDPEHVALLKVLQEPLPSGYIAYPVVLQHLVTRFWRAFREKEFEDWKRQSRIPEELVPAIKEILESLRNPQEQEKTGRRR